MASFVTGNEIERPQLTPEGNSSVRDFERQTRRNHSIENRAPVPKANSQKVREGVPLMDLRHQRSETSENPPIY